MINSPKKNKSISFDSSKTFSNNDSSELLGIKSESEDQDESHSHKENYNFLLEKINSLLIKKKFKTIIKLIEAKEKHFDEINQWFIIYDVKMKCYFKIIEKQLETFRFKTAQFFYSASNKNSIFLTEIFTKLQTFIQKANSFLKTKQNLEQHFKEIIIKNYCEVLYYEAKFSQIKNQFQDSISYLSLAHNILKNFVDFSRDPHTLFLYQNILLFITSFLIEGGSYQKGIMLLNRTLRVCYKELLIISTDGKGFKLSEIENRKKKHYYLVFQNLIICIFQLGFCFENLNLPLSAIEAYKEAHFFSVKFLRKFNPKFCEIVKRTEKLSFKYREEYFKNIQKRELLFKKKQEEEKLKQSFQEKNKKLQKISMGQTYDIEKYSYLDSYLSKFKSQEPNTVNTILSPGYKKHKSHFLYSTLSVYNDLLSRNYSKFVNENDNLFMNNLDKYTAIKLDTYNNKLLSHYHHNLDNKISQTTSNTNSKKLTTNNSECFTSINEVPSTNSQTIRGKTLTISTQIPTQIEKGSSQQQKNNHMQERGACLSASPSNYFNTRTNKNKYNHSKEKVEKFKYKNKYKYTKNYKNKISVLETMNTKEIKFQKQLLNLKKVENYELSRSIYTHYNSVDENKIVDEAENLYIRLKHKANFEFQQKFQKHKETRKEESLDKLGTIKYKLRESAIIGLNPKKFDQIQQINKKETQIQKELNKKYLTTGSNNLENQNDLYIETITNANKNNNIILSNIVKDLDNFRKKEKHLETKYKRTQSIKKLMIITKKI